MLDEAGLDIKNLRYERLTKMSSQFKEQGAKVDVWGVGTMLAAVGASLGAVYKMKARWVNGRMQPVIKVSDNFEKTTVPGDLVVYRLYDRATGMARGDYIALAAEELPDEVELFHPVYTHKRKRVTGYEAQALLVPVFRDGERVYELPSLDAIRQYHRRQLSRFWPEYRRRLNQRSTRYPSPSGCGPCGTDDRRQGQVCVRCPSAAGWGWMGCSPKRRGPGGRGAGSVGGQRGRGSVSVHGTEIAGLGAESQVAGCPVFRARV